MYINEIAPGSTIKIIVSIGVNRLEFETKAVEGISVPTNGLIVDAIRKKGKLINFSVKGVLCGIFVIDDQTQLPYQWKIVKIRKVKMKGVFQHVILTQQEVEPFNRRTHFRVWIGLAAILQVGKNQTTYNVTIHDISARGISFICLKEIDIAEGALIHATFFDESTGTSFNITAIIVRQSELDELRVIWGCKLNVELWKLIDLFNKNKESERKLEQIEEL